MALDISVILTRRLLDVLDKAAIKSAKTKSFALIVNISIQKQLMNNKNFKIVNGKCP